MPGLVADAGTLERNGGLPEAGAAHVGMVAKQARDKARSWGSSDNPYDILGVRRGASAREIRAAYLRLVKELHPDGRTPDPDHPDHDANERLKAINAAYRKLKAGGGGAGRRGWARGTLFAVGVLTSALPLFAAMGAYYAGWLGVRTPVPGIVAAPQSKGTASGRSVEKDSAVGRQMAFAHAKTQATKAAWVNFIADYPGGDPEALARQAIAAIERAEAAEARKRQEHLAWLAAEKGTKADLQQFLARYADGEHAGKARLALAAIAGAEAKAKAEQAAWAVAEGAGTKEALQQRFLDKHHDAPQAPQAGKALAAIASAEAKAKAEQETWIKAKGDGGKAALHTYLSEHPSGRHAAEAKARLARLETDEKDDEAWRLALRRNSKAAYTGYVSAHPKGRRVAEARVRIAELGRAGAPAKAAVREARVEPVKAPSVRPPRPPTAAVQEPFVGADGRIRR